MNLRHTFLYLLDIIFIVSLASIVFILVTGGIRIDFIGFDLISVKRPFLLLIISFLLKKLFYRRINFKEDPLNRLLLILESCPTKKIKIYIFFISLLCFSLVGSRIVPRILPGGDEPHFLMIASSLLNDADLNLRNNYDKGDYYEFYPGPLTPHAKIYEEDKIYSAHGVGLPILILPGYFLASRYGASFIIGILFSLLSVVLFSLSHRITGNKIVSISLSFLMSFTMPLVFYSFQLFAEPPATLIVACLFLFCLVVGEKQPSLFKRVFIGLLLAFLPWLHVRYIMFTAIMLVYLCCKMKFKRILPVAGIVISSILLLLLYMKALYGVASLTAQYCGIKAGISYLSKGLIGNFVDCRFGLFLYSPYYMFLGAGLYFFYKNNKRQFLWWALVVIPFFISVSSYYHWHGGCCPPLRYITPIVPLFIIPLGYFVMSCKDRFFYILFFIFIWFSFAIKNIISDMPLLMYNSEYSSNQVLDYFKSQGINIEWLFPSLFETTIKDYIIIAVWLVFLILLNYGIVQLTRSDKNKR